MFSNEITSSFQQFRSDLADEPLQFVVAAYLRGDEVIVHDSED